MSEEDASSEISLAISIMEEYNDDDWVTSKNYERGTFDYIEELNKCELVEGVKCKDGKKIRARWVYDPTQNQMIGFKVLKECENPKCNLNSENCENVFHLCARCKEVFYCERRCQRNDWQRHKLVCREYRSTVILL